MCLGSAVRADIRVSIQDSSARHLAAGLLVDADMILIPAPPDSLWENATQAAIFPAALNATSKIDRIRTWKWSKFALQGQPPTAITAKLLHHSTYAAQISPLESDDLVSLLDSGVPLWQALKQLGAIAGDIDQIDPQLLDRLAEVEAAQLEPRRASHNFGSFGQMVPGFCIFFCFCHEE